MTYIDKWIAKDLSVTVLSLDKEFEKNLEKEKKEEDEFLKEMEELDVIFLRR